MEPRAKYQAIGVPQLKQTLVFIALVASLRVTIGQAP
jgi:hypothetical protein